MGEGFWEAENLKHKYTRRVKNILIGFCFLTGFIMGTIHASRVLLPRDIHMSQCDTHEIKSCSSLYMFIGRLVFHTLVRGSSNGCYLDYFMLHAFSCFVVCYSVTVAVCCNALQCVAQSWPVEQNFPRLSCVACIVVFFSLLQCVVVCCSVL